MEARQRESERPHDGVEAHGLKERGGFDLANHLVLLDGGDGGKARSSSDFGLRPPVQIGNALCVQRSLCGIERRERAIDEGERPGLASSRTTIDRGQDPRRESGNHFRLRRRQRPGLGHKVRGGLLTGEGKSIFDFDQVSRRPGGTGRHRGLEEGSSSMKIGHAEL